LNWVKKYKLSAIEAIQHNGQLCIELGDLWQTLYLSFNLAQNCLVNLLLLDKILGKETMKWVSFSKEELRSAIKKCNNILTPRPGQIVLEISQDNHQR